MLSAFSDMRWLRIIFLLCALPTGLAFAFITPIGQVADEPAHIARAGALLHGQIIGERRSGPDGPVAGFEVDGGLIRASISELPSGRAAEMLNGTATGMASPIPPVAVTAAQRNQAQSIPWMNKQQFDVAPGSVPYFPTFYVPGAIGIEFAKLLGIGPLAALYVGRVFMLMVFLLIGYAAIAAAKFGHGLFFSILCLPMTLSLAASFNQDGLLIATTTLACSLLTNRPSDKPSSRSLGVLLFSLVIASKLPYAIFLLCACLPFSTQSIYKQARSVFAYSLLILIWVYITIHYVAVAMPRDPYHPGIFWPGDHKILLHSTNTGYNIKVLLAKPILILVLPIAIFFEPGLIYFKEMVGVFGWLTIHLPIQLYIVWFITLIAAILSVPFGSGKAGLPWVKTDALFVGLGLYSTILLIGIAIYVSWTNVGLARIEGSQGRYYLLLLPFLVFILPRFRGLRNLQGIEQAHTMEVILSLPAILMSLVDIFYIPKLMSKFF